MAWSFTSLANYNEPNGPAASRTTGTLSIPANSIILVFAHASLATGGWSSATLSVSDSVDGSSGWTGLDSQVNLGDALYDGGGRLFYKSFSGSASRTITIARSSGTAEWGYSVIAVTGQDSANPIIQAKGTGTRWADYGHSHSQTVTLDNTPTSGNAVIWFMGVNNDADGAATLPSGYTALDNPSAQFAATHAAYHTATTTAALTSSDCGNSIQYAIAFAVELKADPGTATGWFRYYTGGTLNFLESFEDGSNGASISTSNTQFSSVFSGGTGVFDNTTSADGSQSMKITSNGAGGNAYYVQRDVSPGSSPVYARFAMLLPTLPANNIILVAVGVIGNTAAGEIRVTPTGTIQLRHNAVVQTTSSTTAPIGSWFVIEYLINNPGSAQSARIYSGLSSSIQETINATFTLGTPINIKYGITASQNYSYYLDSVADSYANWVGPL